MTTKLWYWGPPVLTENFGDLMSVALLEHFAGVKAEWAPPEQAEIIVSGSTLDRFPDGWGGVVAGAGMLHRSTFRDLSNATVLGLRGKLTLNRVNLPAGVSPVIADPGLLASELVNPQRNRFPLGVVPHWSDMTLWDRFKHIPGAVAIPAMGDPLEVTARIGSCRKIVTSSLHGAVVADSFGIPRRIEPFPGMKLNPKHEGSGMKFEDYCSALDMPLNLCKHGGEIAPPEKVERLQAALFEMFQQVAKCLA